jgi:hypothetical protein
VKNSIVAAGAVVSKMFLDTTIVGGGSRKKSLKKIESMNPFKF